MLFGGGEKIEYRAAVGNDGLQLFDNRDLCTDFGGVGRFREHALHLLFFFLLWMSGERQPEETSQQAGGGEDRWPEANHHHLREEKIVMTGALKLGDD